MNKQLYRDETRKQIAGVCAGLADHFGIEVTTMRVIFLVALFLHGVGGLIYVVLWVALPGKTFMPKQPFVNYKVPPQQSPYTDYTVPPQQTYADYSVPNMPPVMPKQQAPIKNGPSNGAIIGGTIMVVIGVLILLKQFHILSIWHFAHYWPVSLIIVGLVFVVASFSGKSVPADDLNDLDDNSSNTNNPTI